MNVPAPKRGGTYPYHCPWEVAFPGGKTTCLAKYRTGKKYRRHYQHAHPQPQAPLPQRTSQAAVIHLSPAPPEDTIWAKPTMGLLTDLRDALAKL